MIKKTRFSFLLSLIILSATACTTLEPTPTPDDPIAPPQESPAEPIAPKILSFDLSPDALTVTLTAKTKQGSKGISTATVFWGDGQSDEINNEFETISLSHSYTDPGLYQVKLELSDGTLTSAESKTFSAKQADPIGEKVKVTFERIQLGQLLDCEWFGVFINEAALSGSLSLNGTEVWSVAEQSTESLASLELDVMTEIDVFYGEDAFIEIEGELLHALNPTEKLDTWSIKLPLNDGLYKSYVTDDGTGTRVKYCYAGLYYQIERSGFLY